MQTREHHTDRRTIYRKYMFWTGVVNVLIVILLTLLLILCVTKMTRQKPEPCPTEQVTTAGETEPPLTLPPTARQKIKDYAEAHHIPYTAYPESLVQLLEHNPEVEEFVLQYPEHKKIPLDMTRFQSSEEVPLFLQWDPMWGYEEYGSDVIGITGCGPTCLAMAGFYLTKDIKFNPADVAAFAEDNGYYIKGNGSSWNLISKGGEKLGLDVREIPLDEHRILSNLEVGNPVICVVGPGDFTTEGHFIVLTECVGGQIRVNDPNSLERSNKLWSYGQLAPQIQNLWAIRN